MNFKGKGKSVLVIKKKFSEILQLMKIVFQIYFLIKVVAIYKIRF